MHVQYYIERFPKPRQDSMLMNLFHSNVFPSLSYFLACCANNQ